MENAFDVNHIVILVVGVRIQHVYRDPQALSEEKDSVFSFSGLS